MQKRSEESSHFMNTVKNTAHVEEPILTLMTLYLEFKPEFKRMKHSPSCLFQVENSLTCYGLSKCTRVLLEKGATSVLILARVT